MLDGPELRLTNGFTFAAFTEVLTRLTSDIDYEQEFRKIKSSIEHANQFVLKLFNLMQEMLLANSVVAMRTVHNSYLMMARQVNLNIRACIMVLFVHKSVTIRGHIKFMASGALN